MFRQITARQELATSKQVAALLPTLVGDGVSLEDSFALAHNVVLLFYVLVLTEAPAEPADLLGQLSLDEISGLCARYYHMVRQEEHGFGREEEPFDTGRKITKTS